MLSIPLARQRCGFAVYRRPAQRYISVSPIPVIRAVAAVLRILFLLELFMTLRPLVLLCLAGLLAACSSTEPPKPPAKATTPAQATKLPEGPGPLLPYQRELSGQLLGVHDHIVEAEGQRSMRRRQRQQAHGQPRKASDRKDHRRDATALRGMRRNSGGNVQNEIAFMRRGRRGAQISDAWACRSFVCAAKILPAGPLRDQNRQHFDNVSSGIPLRTASSCV